MAVWPEMAITRAKPARYTMAPPAKETAPATPDCLGRGAGPRKRHSLAWVASCCQYAPMTKSMLWLQTHLIAVSVVAVAAVGAAGAFTFARPIYHPYVMPPPPRDLPYAKASYTAADAKRSFGESGIKLILHSRGPRPAAASPIVDLSTKNLVVEVDAFGDPKKVRASGFSDYITFSNGRWVQTPRSCGKGARLAERWGGNIRVIVNCASAGSSASAWLRRVSIALARL
jgi:hypothetical protein